MLKKVVAAAIATLMFVASLAGCGTKAKPVTGGKVATDGSTSMEKVIGVLGEAFQKDNPGISFTYNPTGSGAGITAVSTDRCDIGLSSRRLREKEKEQGLTETILAYDGIAMIVHPENPVTNLTVEDLRKIYKGELKNWKEVGGKDAEIVCIGREAGSGTRDGFESITQTKDNCKYRQELTSTGDVIATVAGNPNALGYASLASVKKSVKAVAVNSVSPSEATIKDGSYTIQRPFILVTKKDQKLSASAQLFFDFATSDKVRDMIRKAGVVPAK